MTELRHDRLVSHVLPDRAAVGVAAADHAGQRLKAILGRSERARVIFAAAASQAEFLDELAEMPDLDWSRVDAFHLDEYVGLAPGDERSFGEWLERRIWSRVRPGRIEKLDGAAAAADPDAECARYARLLNDGGIDLALIGVGENGHLAFNDPHVADFDDPLAVKPVEIDETSRRQQVRDGAFPTFEDVPRLAMTVTMSALLASRSISVVVPGPQKAAAVARMLLGPIETGCPASALRRHPDAVMFIDEAASAGVRP
ncbi:MAG TPA: 6-phosphogluconolactonase [Patescibacteria group bacterium]|nr:6-phosphogluconolactonase [Patescibacteria group bacterium]